LRDRILSAVDAGLAVRQAAPARHQLRRSLPAFLRQSRRTDRDTIGSVAGTRNMPAVLAHMDSEHAG